MGSSQAKLILLTSIALCAVVGYFTSRNYSSPVRLAEQLAREKCSLCHQFPEPELLTKEMWEHGVLRFMAFRMGLPRPGIKYRLSSIEWSAVSKSIPADALISEEEFNTISSYYLKSAPKKLKVSIAKYDSSSQFSIRPLARFAGRAITHIRHDAATDAIFVGDANKRLIRLTRNLIPMDSVELQTPASHTIVTDSGVLVSEVGDLFPSDLRSARVTRWHQQSLSVCVDSVQRLSHFVFDNLDESPSKEIVLCLFGNYTGALKILDLVEQREVVLSRDPGAQMAYAYDWNGDGRKDIIALMTQGNERLVLFENEGELKFTERTLISFPPVYGSSYFELADLDNDNVPEIICTNGDNGDHTSITKPYHAVRILKRQGDRLEEVWNHPLPGAWQARAADFDGDGIDEIAAIALFPDEKQKSETFLYFDREDFNFNFIAKNIPSLPHNHWMTMEIFDQDGDGDPDILLGAFNFEDVPGRRNEEKSGDPKNSPVVLLQNR